MPLAYSYQRFSSVEQAKGDSLRRQQDLAKKWCHANGLELDDRLTLRDCGVSAFRGKHRKSDRFALASFLSLVEKGEIARGSYLVIESLDRLTREETKSGLILLLNLIERGIKVVQLQPSPLVFDQNSDEMSLMLAIVELSRGHRESLRKSGMIRASWQARRAKARIDKVPMTKRAPCWLEVKEDKFHPIPWKVRTIKEIFRLSCQGHGIFSIARKFNLEEKPNIGSAKKWNKTTINRVLMDRRVLGELQPKAMMEADREAIPAYYPAIIDESTWQRARMLGEERRNKPGRKGTFVNLFSGMIHDAEHGDVYRTHHRKERSALISYGQQNGQPGRATFPHDDLEQAILAQLKELDPAKVLDDERDDEVELLGAELAGIERRISSLEAELLEGDVASIARALRSLEAKKKELLEKLHVARRKARNETTEAWAELKKISPKDGEMRTRLRTALRAMI
ncbi:MAG: recombinase family protein, partial [Gemmataceae bacterium]